jgi:hypothetical protein
VTQGEVLEGEVAMAAAEEGQETKQRFGERQQFESSMVS